MPTLAATWHLGEVFLVILEFALFFIFIWLLISVFADLKSNGAITDAEFGQLKAKALAG